MDQLCAAAEVSKRTLYQHFASKDELVAEHLRRFDPDVLPEVFDSGRPHTARAAARRLRHPLAALSLHRGGRRDPGPRRTRLACSPATTRPPSRRDFTAAAREAGAAQPERLGEQLALLLDGASARSRVLDADAFATASAIATLLVDDALPVPRKTAQRQRRPVDREGAAATS